MRTMFLKEVLFRNIEKESNGRLKIEQHWNGELSSSYDALKNIAQNGVADITVVVPEYVGNLWSRQLLFKSFPIGPSGKAQVALIRKLYKEIPAFDSEIEATGVRRLMTVTGYPVAFFSTKPIRSLDDMKSQKWRTASFWHQDFLRAYGAVPVRTPWDETTTKALRNGDLDGVMVNIDGGNEFGINQAAPNVLTAKELWMGHVYCIVINSKVWAGLSEEDKKAIGRAVERSYKDLGKWMDDGFDEELDKLRARKAGLRILSPDELQKFKTRTNYKQLQQRWVADQVKAGFRDMPEVLQKMTAIIER